ncbi:hypothetical protein AYI70_g706 [Smittium culicis]|uniref:Uncharacterized protein n=1 Tax=Smittium culicis TaxID=133412 RepID=A0A1R1YFR1_9FUNG|nr:hypothetical protein AYI70_g706 [Smittium culicis]
MLNHISEYSLKVLGTAKATQSEVAVGNKPIIDIRYSPNITPAKFTATNTSFCSVRSSFSPLPLDSSCINCSLTAISARTGVVKTIPVISRLNICTLVPLMYDMNICIGNVFAGPNATSHARLLLKNVSSTSPLFFFLI